MSTRSIIFALAGLVGITSILLLAHPVLQPVPSSVSWHIFLQLQIPLWLTAVLVGATLAISGATLQVVLNNPLADPGIIGITSGASLAAALMLLLAPQWALAYFHYWLPLACFAGAILSTLVVYRLALRLPMLTTTVVLAGLAISTLASAVMAWLYVFSDAQSLRNLTFWLMGSLHQADWWVLSLSAPIMVLSIGYQLHQRAKLNLLYNGELTAAAAGVNPRTLTLRCLIAAAIGVGAAVAVAGSIAFVGLLIPHYLRLIGGHNNRFVLPASALAGALLLLIVALAGTAAGVIHVPVSLITATVGGPLLLLALVRGQWR